MHLVARTHVLANNHGWLRQTLGRLVGQCPLPHVNEKLILHGISSHRPSIILVSLSFKRLRFLMFGRLGIKDALFRALRCTAFLELCENVSIA